MNDLVEFDLSKLGLHKKVSVKPSIGLVTDFLVADRAAAEMDNDEKKNGAQQIDDMIAAVQKVEAFFISAFGLTKKEAKELHDNAEFGNFFSFLLEMDGKLMGGNQQEDTKDEGTKKSPK